MSEVDTQDTQATWTAQIRVMSGKYWVGPYAVAVTAGQAHVAASRAVRAIKKKLKPRTRIKQMTIALQRQDGGQTESDRENE